MELHYFHDGTTLYSQKVNAYILSCTTISGPRLKSSHLHDHIYCRLFWLTNHYYAYNKDSKGNWCKRIKLTVFGKTKCKLCGDEVRFALKHLRGKHRDVYSREVVSKIKMSDVMKKYFYDY
jgi:hypothetical protein